MLRACWYYWIFGTNCSATVFEDKLYSFDILEITYFHQFLTQIRLCAKFVEVRQTKSFHSQKLGFFVGQNKRLHNRLHMSVWFLLRLLAHFVADGSCGCRNFMVGCFIEFSDVGKFGRRHSTKSESVATFIHFAIQWSFLPYF